ncbi:hypothetical protein MKZ38_004601 [Zalerion maritima]|uniref:Uncharacterized protein n=1 Tax=Zalerion maritima TaxID=339359 RepID=A0AAD5RWF5_9PEZI|nr:hypothetical protein MKZ38_004601 [Zalerion maritima]
MTDNDASPSRQQQHHHNRQPGPKTLAVPHDRRSFGSSSYDTGDSSGGERRVVSNPDNTFTTTDSTLVFSSGNPYPDSEGRDADSGQNREGNSFLDPKNNLARSTSADRDDRHPRRSHKPRSTGGFLLSNSLMGGGPNSMTTAASRRREKQYYGTDRKGKKPARAPLQQAQQSTFVDDRRRTHERDESDGSRINGSLQGGVYASYGNMMGEPASSQEVARKHSPLKPNQPSTFDKDSAQIVNMALNLSESRRIAARRNISNPLPPRLAPIPDHAQIGGSLQQHLHQQRRSSRTISPSHRGTPGQRIPSLPVTIETEPGYRYHFSASTLARAQKAKEQLELMVQYRRLLEIIPPLDPSSLSQQPTLGSLQSASNGSVSAQLGNDQVQKLGRPYNPLQYIRNRKVRQRERHTISGESSGFSDVNRVSDWVDEVAKLAATRPVYSSSITHLPPFPDAEHTEEAGAQTGSSKPTVATAKPRRPRVDWVVDPADMIADIYWLEQNDHKKLIEDRHWRRIFPQDATLYARPASKPEETPGIVPDIPSTGSEDPFLHPTERQPIKSNTAPAEAPDQTEAQPHSARERARNKLHDLKGKHHKHGASLHGKDFLRLRRGSLDESSDTDSDARKRRVRQGTISAHSKDALEKQMMELIAKEAQDQGLESPVANADPSLPQIISSKQPSIPHEGVKRPTRLGRSHSRKESKLTDISDAEEKGLSRLRSKTSSPLVSARQSLDVPGHMRVNSLDLDSSLANSPDLRPSRRGSGLIPPIGLDLSPPNSRPSSPARNPFSKVKQKIFRDKSRERSGESKPDEEAAVNPMEINEKLADEPYRTSLDTRRSLDKTRPSSPSPVRRLAARAAGDNHAWMGSMRARDDVGGPRGIFKNPRIDAIIRGSMNKVGEMIWRKGQYNQDSDSDTSTEDSDMEETRGRRQEAVGSPNGNGMSKRPADVSPHAVKHYLDVMPPFTAAPGRGTTTPSELGESQSGMSPPLSPSQKRFDRLKPPRIDVQAISSTATPPSFPLPRSGDSDRSTTGSRSRPSSYVEDARRTSSQLNAVLGMPPPVAAAKPNRLSMATIQSRPWSMCAGEMEHPGSTNTAYCLSRKEVARSRTLMLSTGIKALEISRRASKKGSLVEQADPRAPVGLIQQGGSAWAEISSLAPRERQKLVTQAVTQTQIFTLAAQVLSASISCSTNAFHRSANTFLHDTIPALTSQIGDVRERVNDDLSTQVRRLSDDADGLARDLVVGQRMKVKRVNEVMDKMLRNRRRRFRWVRRLGWLMVEWALVGFMWYVWLVVVLVRVVLGIGRGAGRVGRWLLWL